VGGASLEEEFHWRRRSITEGGDLAKINKKTHTEFVFILIYTF